MCRNTEIRIRVKKEEKEALEQRANEYGLSIAHYVRLLAIKGKIILENPKLSTTDTHLFKRKRRLVTLELENE